MAYQIELASTARKQLDKLPKPTQKRIATAIDNLKETPRPPGTKKLKGADDLWRVRAGSYRVIYQIQDEQLLVLVVKIGHRKKVYK